MIKILHRSSFSSKERMLFMRQLALVLQSGMPLLQGMELLRHRLAKGLQLICLHLHQLLQHGSSLAEAMAQEPQLFSPLAVQLVQAGELSGQLNTVLEELAAYYEQQDKLRSELIKAALYPTFLLLAALCVLLFFLLYILPILASVYAGMGIKPTGSMVWLLALQAWLVENVWLLLIFSAIALVLGRKYGKRLGYCLLSRGWCGNFYGLIHEIRFCKLLALLLESGLNITVAVKTIATTMAGSSFEQQLVLLKNRLERGMDMGTALAGMTGLLSPLTLDLASVGATTGCLPQMLREAAQIRQEDLQKRLLRARELLPPVLLVLVATVIALVVCSVLGPLLEMLSALPQ
ncbi:MAG: type II secretion system F family protein [Phascolarctobacterium sp.]